MVWPASLPEWETPATDRQNDPYIRFGTDSGPGKIRKKGTAQGRDISVSLTVNGSQRQTLDNLFNNSPEFTHNDPKDDTTAEFRFRSPPVYELIVGDESASDRIWRTTLTLRKLP